MKVKIKKLKDMDIQDTSPVCTTKIMKLVAGKTFEAQLDHFYTSNLCIVSEDPQYHSIPILSSWIEKFIDDDIYFKEETLYKCELCEPAICHSRKRINANQFCDGNTLMEEVQNCPYRKEVTIIDKGE